VEFGVPLIVKVAVFPGHIVVSPVIFATGKGFTVMTIGLVTVQAPIVEDAVYVCATAAVGVTVGLATLGVANPAVVAGVAVHV
jgi:hypothetical protein